VIPPRGLSFYLQIYFSFETNTFSVEITVLLFPKKVLVQRNHQKTNTFTHKCRLKICQGVMRLNFAFTRLLIHRNFHLLNFILLQKEGTVANPSTTFLNFIKHPLRITIIMASGGHFAAAIFDGKNVK
jgi:hypothetical protein